MRPASGAEASAKAARVIGAGISGLAAAWHLADCGFAVTVFDRAAAPGGLIGTRQTEHGLVETAANAFVWDPVVASWFQRLDLTPSFPRDASKRRYIFRNGRPRRWPLSPADSLAMAGCLARAAVTRTMAARDGETMAAWGDRVLGAAAREWLLEPAMQGVYASAAGELSASAIFAGRKRGPRRLAAPSGGMGEFVTRMHQRLAGRGVRFEFNTLVDRIEPLVPTVIATAAPAAAQLLAPHAASAALRIADVRVAPLTTVTMFFAPSAADVHGFGVLFPGATGMHALGVLYNSDIFTDRGATRSETWIVGDRHSGLTRWNDDRLLQALADDRYLLTGRRAEPLSAHITRWQQAIPVYDEAIAAVAGELRSLPPWLALAGNYLGRIGVAALLEQGQIAAFRLRR